MTTTVTAMDICQKCGGNVASTDDFDGCLCAAPTFWRSRKRRTAAGEPIPDYEAMAEDEWDSMYKDVVRDLCQSALRIPEDKLTVDLFRRIVLLEVGSRNRLADGHEDFEDFNRVWAVMLKRIERAPSKHMRAVREQLPEVFADVCKVGGRA